MAHFPSSLHREIQDILDHKEYADMTILFEYACQAEREVQERRSKQYSNSFAGQSSTSSSATALPAPSMPTTTPLERTTKPAGASSVEGKSYVNVQNFSTNHALVEELIVGPSIDLSLSHGDLLDDSCDKDE
jgi:hypothetical protein